MAMFEARKKSPERRRHGDGRHHTGRGSELRMLSAVYVLHRAGRFRILEKLLLAAPCRPKPAHHPPRPMYVH